MSKELPQIVISEESENNLWNNAIYVWDTSAICALYSLTPTARDTFLEILIAFHDRIWIPGRVMHEYNRHRSSLLHQPIKEHYQSPDYLSTHYLSKLNNYIDKINSNEFYHPYFREEFITELSSLRDKAKEILDKIRILTENTLEERKKEIKYEAKKDPIYTTLSTFNVGEMPGYQEQIDIVKEGHIRYKHEIPPGYMDSNKTSIDKFGDLIIWKEICEYAKQKNVPIIFICNDTKEDWNAGNPAKGEMVPREELLDEFNSITGKDIWFYNLNGFILNIQKRMVQHQEIKDSFDGLTAVLKELEILELPDDSIKTVCSNCGEVASYDSDEFNWEWINISSEERGMGYELCFEASEAFECPSCGETHNFTFLMYQYPLNVINYVELSAEGCNVVSNPPPELFVQYERFDSCVRCGECTSDINDDGYCQACMDEFDYECNRDD